MTILTNFLISPTSGRRREQREQHQQQQQQQAQREQQQLHGSTSSNASINVSNHSVTHTPGGGTHRSTPSSADRRRGTGSASVSVSASVSASAANATTAAASSSSAKTVGSTGSLPLQNSSNHTNSNASSSQHQNQRTSPVKDMLGRRRESISPHFALSLKRKGESNRQTAKEALMAAINGILPPPPLERGGPAAAKVPSAASPASSSMVLLSSSSAASATAAIAAASAASSASAPGAGAAASTTTSSASGAGGTGTRTGTVIVSILQDQGLLHSHSQHRPPLPRNCSSTCPSEDNRSPSLDQRTGSSLKQGIRKLLDCQRSKDDESKKRGLGGFLQRNNAGANTNSRAGRSSRRFSHRKSFTVTVPKSAAGESEESMYEEDDETTALEDEDSTISSMTVRSSQSYQRQHNAEPQPEDDDIDEAENNVAGKDGAEGQQTHAPTGQKQTPRRKDHHQLQHHFNQSYNSHHTPSRYTFPAITATYSWRRRVARTPTQVKIAAHAHSALKTLNKQHALTIVRQTAHHAMTKHAARQALSKEVRYKQRRRHQKQLQLQHRQQQISLGLSPGSTTISSVSPIQTSRLGAWRNVIGADNQQQQQQQQQEDGMVIAPDRFRTMKQNVKQALLRSSALSNDSNLARVSRELLASAARKNWRRQSAIQLQALVRGFLVRRRRRRGTTTTTTTAPASAPSTASGQDVGTTASKTTPSIRMTRPMVPSQKQRRHANKQSYHHQQQQQQQTGIQKPKSIQPVPNKSTATTATMTTATMSNRTFSNATTVVASSSSLSSSFFSSPSKSRSGGTIAANAAEATTAVTAASDGTGDFAAITDDDDNDNDDNDNDADADAHAVVSMSTSSTPLAPSSSSSSSIISSS